MQARFTLALLPVLLLLVLAAPSFAAGDSEVTNSAALLGTVLPGADSAAGDQCPADFGQEATPMAALTCNASVTCRWGQVLSCSCPGSGNCSSQGPDIECDCTGAPDSSNSCCNYVGGSLPTYKCIWGVKCDNRCPQNSCGGGSCVGGYCNCDA